MAYLCSSGPGGSLIQLKQNKQKKNKTPGPHKYCTNQESGQIDIRRKGARRKSQALVSKTCSAIQVKTSQNFLDAAPGCRHGVMLGLYVWTIWFMIGLCCISQQFWSLNTGSLIEGVAEWHSWSLTLANHIFFHLGIIHICYSAISYKVCMW